MKYSDAKKLLRRCRSIRGLTCLESIYLIAMIDEIQKSHQVPGDLFEIGIYHGRTLAVLNAIKSDNEQVGCCELNPNHIESSKKAIIGMYGQDNVTYIQKSSFDLKTDDLKSPCRLIRIDGLHTAEAVINDLSICLPVLAPGGVIIMDDTFNENSPGVVEGLIEYQRQHSELIPIIQGFGQTVLTRESDASIYREWFNGDGWNDYFSPKNYKVDTRLFLKQPVTIFLRNHLRMAMFRAFGGWLF